MQSPRAPCGQGFCTYGIDDARLPAVAVVTLRHKLVHHSRTLKEENDTPNAERPPAR